MRPIVPNNCANWQVFDFDVKIVNFLKNEAEFSTRNQSKLQSQYGDRIVNLNSNKLPKGLFTLDGIFNSNDEYKGKGLNLATKNEDYIPITIIDGKILNLGKECFELEQGAFVNLCQEFSDTFPRHMMI